MIEEELRNHIADHRDALMSQGLSGDEATDRAIAEAGSPDDIGLLLDREHRPRRQTGMFVLVAALLITGVLVQLFVYRKSGNPTAFAALFMGIAGMAAAYFADFTIIIKHIRIARWVSVLLPLLITISVIFHYEFGGRANPPIAFLSLAFPLCLAVFVYTEKSNGFLGILRSIIVFVVIALLSTRLWRRGYMPAYHYIGAGFVLLMFAAWRKWFGKRLAHGLTVTLLIPVPLLIVFHSGFSYGYAFQRFIHMLNPWNDVDGLGFWTSRIRMITGEARWFGALEPSSEIWQILLNGRIDNIDYMLANVLLKWGWAGFIIAAGLPLLFIGIGVYRSVKQRSGLGQLVSLSVLITLATQTVSYILNNLGLISTGQISLPLVSRGNSALVVNMTLIGFMLSVFRSCGTMKDKKYAMQMDCK